MLCGGARAALVEQRWQGGSVHFSAGYPHLLSSSPLVILSEAKDLVRYVEILSATKHDSMTWV